MTYLATSLLTLSLLGYQPAAQRAPIQIQPPTIITADMLHEAGVMRLGDLPLILTGWDYSTIDGLHSTVGTRFGSPCRENAWSLWIDGHRIDMNLLGVRDLNLLPVALQDIAYLEVYDRPVLYRGVFAPYGLIHVHTRSVATGGSAAVSVWAANESGDPGPFRYLNPGTANVYHIGPEYEGTVAAGGSNWWMRLSLLTRNQPAGDQAILNRTRALAGSFPRQRMVAPSLALGFRGDHSRHSFAAGLTSLEDLFYLPSYGRELPARPRFAWSGLNGTVDLIPRLDVSYRIAWTGNQLADRPNELDLDPDWSREGFSAGWEAVHEGRRHLFTAGMDASRFACHTAPHLTDTTDGLAQAHLSLRRTHPSPLGYDIAVGAQTDGHTVTPQGSAGVAWHTDRSTVLTGRVTYSERFFRQDHTLMFWTARGYDLLDDLGVNCTREPETARSRLMTADVEWQSDLSKELTTRVGACFQRYTHLTLERSCYTYQSLDASFDGPVEIACNQQGYLFGCQANIAWSPGIGLRSRTGASIQVITGGDRQFRQIWDSHPAVTAYTTWHASLCSSFAVGTRMEYRSSTYWSEYAGAKENSDGLYRETVPDFWTLDVIARKSFWKGRINTTALLRNLLGRGYRYHPIGATFDLTLAIRMDVRLDWQ